jgi:AcrR family transcriptional regulator
MKKKDKTELTKEKIIQAAMQQFGTKGYAAATVGAICSGYGIAKGLLYHNFKGKEDLYLACVSRCFADVTTYLQAQDIGADLHRYMEQRMLYFSEHPLCAGVFFEAVLQPPVSLAAEIKERKRSFDCFNRRIYQEALSRMTLRCGVTEEDALAYYEVMQEMFNGYFSSPAYAGKEFETVVAEHERKLDRMLDFMLYGIVKKGESE